ncbi:lysis system i-spanin subunit Rz [Arsenophonus sp. aPb]|nr:lysis system i-spanin subunit Rz [Arsenophonus sp. aPb]WGL99739.1 lysis system i-spanin subunit Rz [Arsenophonus sp. aPb]
MHNGAKRLYVKAVCAKSDNITAATTSLDDARPTQLAPDARRNYLRLRRQLETLEAQYLGLRERVKEIYN